VSDTSPTSPESQSISTTQGDGYPKIEMAFSEMDQAVARVVVRLMVKAGMRKGPSDLLIMEDWVLDRWYQQDAIEYLKEQQAKRRGVPRELYW
jgi:tRNA(Met) C34 N-acetyltransferase TmcA